ncbi:MAG: hypothetical protein FJW21_10375 [Acidimicrobiia bacterium]|nr:hypothetical protein [Acidimicrobiia bacterium]
MRTRAGVCILLAWLVTVAPALAQRAPATAPIGGRIFGVVEGQAMTATDTFDALSGETSLFGGGGGAEVHGVWRKIFLRASASRLSVDGERVFVFGNTVFPLGIPMRVQLTPVEIVAGWRFATPGKRLVPYVGAGTVIMRFREESDFDTSSDIVSKTFSGAVAFAGVDVGVMKFVSVGAEVGMRIIKITRPGGVLGALGEDDLGGVSMRLLVSIGR